MRKLLKEQVNVAEKMLMKKFNQNSKEIRKQYHKEITMHLKHQIENNIKPDGISVALAIELTK